MTEPGPLGIFNVMFPFSLLAAAVFISLVTAIAEEVVRIMNTIKMKMKEVIFLFLTTELYKNIDSTESGKRVFPGSKKGTFLTLQ